MKKAQKTGESILIEGCRGVCTCLCIGERESMCVCTDEKTTGVGAEKKIINRFFLFLIDTVVKLFSLGPWARLNILSGFP